jgi:hypothetical protein
MGFRSLFLATVALGAFASAASAQDRPITNEVVDKLIAGLAAEKPELDKVGDQLTALDEKIAAFQRCYDEMATAARAAGRDLGGISGRVAVRAKCGASNADGMREDRSKLLENPEKVGARAAGMNQKEYGTTKELATMYVGGSRSFAPASLEVLSARATDLANALGMALASADSGGGGGGGRRGAGAGLGGILGGALGGLGMMTMDMTWAYVGYLWGLMYMSGATMFEKPYEPGQWTRWEIVDSSQPDQKLVLERAMFRRDADKTEWWRIKTIMISPESTDTINLESQFKPLDETGTTMQVVRMRGKLPGQPEAQEMIVPEHLTTLSPNGAFPMRPTAESLAGATVGTESISAGGTSYSARHVRFGGAGGSTEWWLSDTAPGGVVRVQRTGQSADEKWTMNMVGAGSGAKSELGL